MREFGTRQTVEERRGRWKSELQKKTVFLGMIEEQYMCSSVYFGSVLSGLFPLNPNVA